MSKDRVVDSLGKIDDDMIHGVEVLRQKKKRPAWVKWGAMAACLCLVVVLGTILGTEDIDCPRLYGQHKKGPV